MKIYNVVYNQIIPAELKDVWNFFTSPNNLSVITPPKINFRVISSDNHKKIFPGMIINYKVSPLFSIEMNWCTEITHVSEEKYFVDEQRFGPYKLWHHQHHFQETEAGVEMTDIINYALPFGIIGRIANGMLVENEIQNIFQFRRKKIEELFPLK